MNIELSGTADLSNAWNESVTNIHSLLSAKTTDIPILLAGASPIHRETAQRFTSIIEKTKMSPKFIEAYSVDAWRFAGFKTNRMIDEITAIAYENKKLISVDKLIAKSDKIFRTYNKNYLRAEIQQANNAALSAERWHSFSDDESRYMLQYRTAGDERVRDDHAPLNGTTLPKSDPFWDSYMPPNGWGCRCEVIEVLASRYEKTSRDVVERSTKNIFKSKNDKPFAFNPGKELKLFPPTASYYNTANIELIDKGIRKNHRSFIKSTASDLLLKETVKIDAIENEIIFTKTGIKEAINQPHENYLYKNQAILNIEQRIKNGEYINFIDDWKKRYKGFHIIETEIYNKKSWILLRERFSGEIDFYTIVDKIK